MNKLKVGQVLAEARGAWQRKYAVRNITRAPHLDRDGCQAWIVGIELLGLYYADGRAKPATKAQEREVVAMIYQMEGEPVRELYFVDGYALDSKTTDLYAKGKL